MHATCSANCRLVLSVSALCAELFHLGWEYTHGGVFAHHLLNNPDMPAISNWWGLLVIPLLTWWLVGRIQRSVMARRRGGELNYQRGGIVPWTGFVAALVYGAALAIAFSLGSPFVNYLFFALLALALVIRAWRAEFVLGFVLGMTFVFGAVLPTLIAGVVAALSWVAHAVAGVVWRRLRPRGGLV